MTQSNQNRRKRAYTHDFAPFLVDSVVVCNGIKGVIKSIENNIIHFINLEDKAWYLGYTHQVSEVIQR